MHQLRILYEDSDLIAIEKPAGFFVHTPEDPRIICPPSRNCMQILKKQTGHYLYPAHRIDRATSGVVLYALNSESASHLGQQFQNHSIQKNYVTVVRGTTLESGIIDHPLKRENPEKSEPIYAITHFNTIATVELPFENKRYKTSRFSLVSVKPTTGAFHQIRRHFKHLSHPLIGDSKYGDGQQNQIFSESLKMPGLFLKAYSIQFTHPKTGQTTRIHSRWNHRWHQVFDLFQVCPWFF